VTKLSEAKAAFKIASRQTARISDPERPIDWNPSGIAELDERRLQAIEELGRPLSPNEAYNLADGRAHDDQPLPPGFGEPDPFRTMPTEHPEEALRRRALALEALAQSEVKT
jgi:hypothetical protein